MPEIHYPQWRDINEEIRYPFEDDATLLDVTEQLNLTNGWLIDAAIYSPIALPPVYLSQIVVDGDLAQLTLMDSAGQELGSGQADRDGGNPIAVLNEDGLPVATLVPGTGFSAAIFAAGLGQFDFLEDAATFVDSCVLASPAASMSGIRVGDDILIGSQLILVGERGIQLDVDVTSEVLGARSPVDVALVRIHAMGDPQHLERSCDDPTRKPGQFIREIVFQYGDATYICKPDDNGNIVLLSESPAVEDSSLRVLNRSDGITLKLMGRAIG